MGDLTYDPNEPRKPRSIASPFGVVPTPGFNVVAPQANQGAPSLMENLWASLPTRQDLKQGTAEALGAPVDMGAWLLHAMGVPISGDKFYGGGAFTRGVSGQPTWAPSPSVPLSSQNIRGMLDNGPSPEALLMGPVPQLDHPRELIAGLVSSPWEARDADRQGGSGRQASRAIRETWVHDISVGCALGAWMAVPARCFLRPVSVVPGDGRRLPARRAPLGAFPPVLDSDTLTRGSDLNDLRS
jgi:hypothetical protein